MKQTTVHLIHGFHQDHPVGAPPIAMLGKYLIGRPVEVHDYGKLYLGETTANDNIARLILSRIAPGDSVIAFSNGAAIVAALCAMGADFDSIVLIQPALASNWRPPAKVDWMTVFWNPYDRATIAGKWWRRVTRILPWRWQAKHNWGEMGHTGYTGKPDPRIKQYNTATPLAHNLEGFPVIKGHSEWKQARNLAWHALMASHA